MNTRNKTKRNETKRNLCEGMNKTWKIKHNNDRGENETMKIG